MTRKWQFPETGNTCSEVLAAAMISHPQIITRRGTEAVIVLSYAEYQTMLLKQKKLSTFFHESPLFGAELDLTRGS